MRAKSQGLGEEALGSPKQSHDSPEDSHPTLSEYPSQRLSHATAQTTQGLKLTPSG